MNNLFNKAHSKLKLLLLANKHNKSFNYKDISISEIPDEYTKFGDSDDEWKSVKFSDSDNITGALYKSKGGTLIPPHKHSKNSEQIIIMNRGGKINITTTDGSKIIEFPDSYYLDKNVIHSVEFITETKILIIWAPKFNEGWSGDFIEL